MAITANIGVFNSEFIASLSDGHSIEAASLRELANTLFRVGVVPGNVQYQWRAGQRMLTAGQQAAFAAEMRSLGGNTTALTLIQSAYQPVDGYTVQAE